MRPDTCVSSTLSACAVPSVADVSHRLNSMVCPADSNNCYGDASSDEPDDARQWCCELSVEQHVSVDYPAVHRVIRRHQTSQIQLHCLE